MLGKLQRRIAYYKKLQQVQQLSEKQQKKFDSYSLQLKQIKPETKTFNAEGFKAYLERNNEMSRQRNKQRIRYEIGDLKFHSQYEANAYFQDYLKEHEEIDENCLALVKRHPEFEEGDKVEIRPNETYNQYKNFVIVKPNGGVNHVSVKTCLKGRYDIQHIKKVFRDTVKPQIDEFKQLHTQPKECPLCRKAFTNDVLIHIDHVKPFKAILNDFINENEINLKDIKTVQYKSLPVLADEELKNKWLEYHKTHAQLQFLCSKCNSDKSDS